MLGEARALLARMKKEGIAPTRATYNTLVSAYARLGWIKQATNVVEAMTAFGLEADLWTYNVLAAGLCQAGKVDEAFRACLVGLVKSARELSENLKKFAWQASWKLTVWLKDWREKANK